MRVFKVDVGSSPKEIPPKRDFEGGGIKIKCVRLLVPDVMSRLAPVALEAAGSGLNCRHEMQARLVSSTEA